MNDTVKKSKWMIQFEHYLKEDEKSEVTIEKYLRDVRSFLEFIGQKDITKQQTIAYKKYLSERYAVSSVNSMLVAMNAFLRFIQCSECCVKLLKIQRQIFSSEERELNKEEYRRLVKAAETAGNTRIGTIIQTICGTGIRVSELQFITVEAVKKGRASVYCKNKTRMIFFPAPLQKLLNSYIKKHGIQSGVVFLTRNGKPLNRSNIWREMKALCRSADVEPSKVFPHNLRHLFARTFYSIEKDIVRLADLLGHASVNTTRIYTMETGYQQISRLERVQTLLTT